MKQYTTPEQTAKLIELGFEKPYSIASVEPICGMGGISVAKAYTIGELMEMLPTIVDDFTLWIGRDERSNQWFVKYHPRTLVVDEELIDALYDMCIKLQEELCAPRD
jgi:hypothetical protein